MLHVCTGTPKAVLLQRGDWRGTPAFLQEIPIGKQFIHMQFRPSFNQALLPLGKQPGNKSNRRNRKYGNMFLIVSVKK